MANHKQALKRHRQSLVRRDRNQHFTSMMRTYLKKARLAIAEKSADADELVRKAISVVDSVAQKGAIPKNAAARTVGRLMKLQSKG